MGEIWVFIGFGLGFGWFRLLVLFFLMEMGSQKEGGDFLKVNVTREKDCNGRPAFFVFLVARICLKDCIISNKGFRNKRCRIIVKKNR